MASIRLLLFSCFCFAITLAKAQPIPCEEPPTMTSFCVDACIICDIDGFTGRHESNSPGEAPPGFCTFVVHNAQWIAFIAGSVDIQVELSVSNCQTGLGLEFALYESTDCQSFNLISNCFGGATNTVGQGESGVISNNQPLVIGQYYYIVMDGALGDNCDWTFNVLEGSTEVSPLNTSGSIVGDQTVCPELTHSYTVEGTSVGATNFSWTLDGSSLAMDSTSIEVDFPGEGTYSLCVTATNACDEGPPSCQTIFVNEVPETFLSGALCEGEVYMIEDTLLSTGGVYQFNLINQEGCDSTVILDLEFLPTPSLDLDITICQDDTLTVGNVDLTAAGNYELVLNSAQGCDSVVTVALSTVICLVESEIVMSPVQCFGEASGQLQFSVSNGTPPFTYSWTELNGTIGGSGNITALGENILIPDLIAGTYVITIEDDFGNNDIIIEELIQPEALMVDFEVSDFNGFAISCDNSEDGTVTALPFGGTPGYDYFWDANSANNTITDLSVGIYPLTVTDANGCVIETSVALNAPSPMLLDILFLDPDCDGPETGQIIVDSIQGGVGGYNVFVNNDFVAPDWEVSGLSAGAYTVEVVDANDCLIDTSITLTAPEIPIITLPDTFSVQLGSAINLDASINLSQWNMLTWSGLDSLSCKDCLNPQVFPLETAFYALDVISADDCQRQDSVLVQVKKFRKLFVPNVFSPNGDGANDTFTLFGSIEVEQFEQFRIYNRWGALMYEGLEQQANNGIGWDGTFKGEPVENGVYVWTAEVVFIDGLRQSLAGSITLSR